MPHEWIIDVLTDLGRFARKNGMHATAAELKDVCLVAMAEMAEIEAGQGTTGQGEIAPGKIGPGEIGPSEIGPGGIGEAGQVTGNEGATGKPDRHLAESDVA